MFRPFTALPNGLLRSATRVAGPAMPKTGVFAALEHRDFRLLLLGNLATQLGQWTQQVGQGWLVYQLTHSEFQLGLVAFCNGMGMVMGSPVGGALADRFQRRKVISFSQTMLAAIALTLAFLVMTGHIQIWNMYLTALGSGILFGINGPSRQSLVHDMVSPQHLSNAIALNTVTMNSMRVIGPSIGGAMIGTVGIQGTFFMQAGGYVTALVMLFFMRSNNTSTAAGTPFFSSIVAGTKYVRRQPVIATLLAMAVFSALLGMVYQPLMPAYVGKVLHSNEGSLLGWILTCGGVGGLFGAFGVALLGEFRWKGRLLLGVVICTGLLQALLGGVSALPVVFFTVAGLGFTGAITLTMNNTLLQTMVDDEYRGRVMSLYFISFGIQPIGALVAGRIAESWGLQHTLLGTGALVAAGMVMVALLARRVREL